MFWIASAHYRRYRRSGLHATGINQLVDFSGPTKNATADGNGVYNLNYGSAIPTDHSQMGVFNFTKVGSSDIWFGAWSQTSSASDGTHSVYYVGDSTGTTIPTSGTATYTVVGISKYSTNGLPSGTSNADFGSATLTGNLANSASTYQIAAAINAVSGSFSGAASSSNTSATGTVTGNFYGVDAASLTGIASFGGNSVYDVAFGGTKD